jgi:hypothetical protein
MFLICCSLLASNSLFCSIIGLNPDFASPLLGSSVEGHMKLGCGVRRGDTLSEVQRTKSIAVLLITSSYC